eukprot:gene23950-27103_t
MGAAVTIELSKPADASDVASTNSLEFATNEIVRLRSDLGYLAQRYGMQVMPNNADDLITEECKTESKYDSESSSGSSDDES